MSKKNIPNREGTVRQGNRGEAFGEIIESFNIDLSSSPSKIKTSDKLSSVLDASALGNPASVNDLVVWTNPPSGGDRYYIITEDNSYECSINNDPTDPANWSVSLSNKFDLESTAALYSNNMLVSLDDDISHYDGSTYNATWWTSTISGTGLTQDFPHTLHTHKGGEETLFVTDKNLVRYYNSSSGHSTVTLQEELVAVAVDSGVSAIWVGTYNNSDGNAYVYEMYIGETTAGGTPVARNAYKVEGRSVLALWVKDNIPYIMTERGVIQAFNGAGFVTVTNGEFPFTYSGRALINSNIGGIQPVLTSRPVHPRGVKIYNDSSFILINAKTEEDAYATDNRSHSGVWEYNHKTQTLNHRFAFCDESTDFGAAALQSSGPLVVVDNQYTFLMAAAEATSGDDSVFMTSSVSNISWFVTPEYTADTVKESYESVYHKAKTLASGEAIYTLYRTTKRDTVYGTAYWTDTNKFNTTDDWSGIAVGDLIRVSSGYATGQWAIVKEISSSATTYSITLHKDVGTEGEESKVYSDNYSLVGFDKETLVYNEEATYTSSDGEVKEVGIGETAPWIQYMVILEGDIEYRQFISKGNAKNTL